MNVNIDQQYCESSIDKMKRVMIKAGYSESGIKDLDGEFLKAQEFDDRFVYLWKGETDDKNFIVSEFFKPTPESDLRPAGIADYRAKPIAETYTREEGNFIFEETCEGLDYELCDTVMEIHFEYSHLLQEVFEKMDGRCDVLDNIEAALEMALDQFRDELK